MYVSNSCVHITIMSLMCWYTILELVTNLFYFPALCFVLINLYFKYYKSSKTQIDTALSSPSKYDGQVLQVCFFQQFGQYLTQEAHSGLI